MMHRECRLFAIGTVVALPLWGQTTDSLAPSSHPTHLANVVITATGIQDRSRVGSAITVIDVDSVLRTTPAQTLTDVLESRVPGLTVMHTSGVPGAPSLVYLRGEGNISASNQPIVILDGIKLSANRSAPPVMNLADAQGGFLLGAGASSSLDQIDPHGIATIEILHGPSAAGLYGSDAAAGVIILTTKRGARAEAGKNTAHLAASATGGWSSLLGSYPTNFFRFGSDALGAGGSANGLCSATDPACTVDSVVRFQALNTSRYSPFGDGGHADGSLTLSGALSALAYSLTGSASGATGILQLPSVEVSHFQQVHGAAPPGWIATPDYYGTQSGLGTFSFPLSRQGSVALTGALFNSNQQSSSLQNAIGELQGAYVDPTVAQQQGLFGNDYFDRSTSHSLTSTAGATVHWPLAPWLPLQGTLGLDHVARHDKLSHPSGYTTGADSLGFLRTGDATATTTTGMLSTLLPPLGLGSAHMTTALGVSALRTANLTSLASYDPTNGTAAPLQLTSTARLNTPAASTFGGFVEPQFELTPRLFVNAGVRWDQNHVGGLPSTVTAYPHADASWIASDEPFLHIKSALPFLRFRLAYGYAGAQADMLSLTHVTVGQAPPLAPSIAPLNGVIFTRPDRSRELEGGVDADLWGGRVSLTATAYRKTSHNTVFATELVAPSVEVSGTSIVLQGDADVRNAGLEGAVTARLLQRSLLSWTLELTASRNDNVVPSVTPALQGLNVAPFGTRIAAGAPLFGRWALPITGFADVNHDGEIEPNEVQVGDTPVSLGSELPRDLIGINSRMTFFGGRLSAATTVAYTGGFSQADAAAVFVSASGTSAFGNTANAPNATLQQKAAVTAISQTPIGVIQTVHTLRWSDVSLTYNIPTNIARHAHMSAMSVTFLGSNLALQTNYHGIDPSVNVIPTEAGLVDLGEVPQPRSWALRLNLGT